MSCGSHLLPEWAPPGDLLAIGVTQVSRVSAVCSYILLNFTDCEGGNGEFMAGLDRENKPWIHTCSPRSVLASALHFIRRVWGCVV